MTGPCTVLHYFRSIGQDNLLTPFLHEFMIHASGHYLLFGEINNGLRVAYILKTDDCYLRKVVNIQRSRS